MTKSVLLLTILASSLLAPAIAMAAQPAKGIYVGYHQRVSATPSCGIQAGATWTAYLYYPGPIKTGAVVRLEYDVPTGNPVLQSSAYPMTPAAGAASWSGTLTETDTPPGTIVTKAFSIAITYNDTKSWFWDRTVTVGACTAEDKIVLVRSGA